MTELHRCLPQSVPVPGDTEIVITAHDPSTHSVPAGTKGSAGKDEVNKQETHIPSPRAHHKAASQARWWIRQKRQAVRDELPHINWK